MLPSTTGSPVAADRQGSGGQGDQICGLETSFDCRGGNDSLPLGARPGLAIALKNLGGVHLNGFCLIMDGNSHSFI